MPARGWIPAARFVIDPLFWRSRTCHGQPYTQRFPYDGNWDGSKVEAVRPIPRVTLPGTNTLC